MAGAEEYHVPAAARIAVEAADATQRFILKPLDLPKAPPGEAFSPPKVPGLIALPSGKSPPAAYPCLSGIAQAWREKARKDKDMRPNPQSRGTLVRISEVDPVRSSPPKVCRNLSSHDDNQHCNPFLSGHNHESTKHIRKLSTC
ncbi:hypothetical protein, partial [Oryzibacter oryziterrae]|uniref:hypothetical protein n=1 Tax=Oryzibacter oryziterrae TaxID=2766474 RepID=UPI001F449937